MFFGLPRWSRMAPSPRRRARRTRMGMASLVAACSLAAVVHAATPPITPPVASFNTRFGHYLADPVRPRVYALDSESGMYVINTDTLTVEKTITVGRVPEGLSMSADGTTLYVVSVDGLDVSVIDLETLERVRTMALVSPPSDIEAGLDSRLYIANISGELLQMNAETGEVEASLYGAGLSPELEISPDRKTLYSGADRAKRRGVEFRCLGGDRFTVAHAGRLLLLL